MKNMIGERIDSSYDDPDKLLNDFFDVSSSSNTFMYRGISRDNQKYPNIMRVRNNNDYYDLSAQEFDMLKEFRKYASSLLDSDYSSIDLVSCAQHFGIPTRLLDWTTDPFVALYFSLSANPESVEGFKYRIFICNKEEQSVLDDIFFNTYFDASFSDNRIHAFKGFSEIINTNEEERIKAYCKELGNEYKPKRFYVLNANNSNMRINAQSGLFVIPRELKRDSIDREYKEAGVKVISINNSIREEVLGKLENMGYSKVKLYFDLQNIAEYIRENALKNITFKK